MQVKEFFPLFLAELKEDTALQQYYRFHQNKDSFAFRKAYFCQRLQYIASHIGSHDNRIWDCGCGYGTTALFLALNGYQVFGTTIEFYYNAIEKRLQFWSQFGDVSGFRYQYNDLFETNYQEQFDAIIVQDTLHHVEPVEKGLLILRNALAPSGRLIVVEENGANIIQNLILIKKRGFQKTKRIYDGTLKKTIIIGNENIRSLKQWKHLLEKGGFQLQSETIQHIRFYHPWFLRQQQAEEIALKEEKMANASPLLRKFFFFGINFQAIKV